MNDTRRTLPLSTSPNECSIQKRSVGEHQRLYGAVKFLNDWHAGGSTLESVARNANEAERWQAARERYKSEKETACSSKCRFNAGLMVFPRVRVKRRSRTQTISSAALPSSNTTMIFSQSTRAPRTPPRRLRKRLSDHEIRSFTPR